MIAGEGEGRDSAPIPPLVAPLALAGIVLIVSYALISLTDLVPLQLLDPAWITRLCRTMTRWAFLPLLGTALVHLADALAPEAPGLQRLLRRCRRLAAILSLLLLLLIPLQGFGVLRAVDLSGAQARQARQRAELRFRRLRQITSTASSGAALQEGLLALQGPVLPPAALRLPLPRLRRQVLVELRLGESEVMARLGRLALERSLWPGLLDLLHVSGMALLYSLALAAFSDLIERVPALPERLLFGPRAREIRSRHAEEQAYLEAISDEEPPAG